MGMPVVAGCFTAEFDRSRQDDQAPSSQKSEAVESDKPGARSGSGHGSLDIGEETEILIEPRAFQDHPNAILRASEQEGSAFVFQALHGADQDRDAGAVDVGNTGEIHDEPLGFLVVDDRAK